MAERNLVEELKQLAELHASGAITDDEYAKFKEKLLADDNKTSAPNLPAVQKEMNDPKYTKEYSDENFWDKIASVARKAGAKVIYPVLQLWYAMQNPNCPTSTKATIIAALGYFILPFDLIPDFIPVIGYSDDLIAIGYAITMASSYIDDEVKRKAREKMCSIFGDDILSELD